MRKSQQVVQFDPRGNGWLVRESADADSSPPHVPTTSHWAPAPERSRSPTLTMRSQLSPPPNPPPPQRRTPFAPIDANQAALVNEIRQLEKQVAGLKQIVKLQNKLNSGLTRALGS
jgi:hypothetical protein